jgi:hypothetical protein
MQAHSFNVVPASPATIRGNLDFMAAAGVPLYISEFDIDKANDQEQLQEFQLKFPVVWEHPAVVGVTLWGYLVGRTFLPNSGLMFSDGRERPALTWLREFTRNAPPASQPSRSDIVIRASGTSGAEHINLLIDGAVVADFTLTTSPQDYVYRGRAPGEVRVEFDNDAQGRDVILDFVFVNNEIREAEAQALNTATFGNGTCGGGSLSQVMNCNGVIGFGDTGACVSGNCADRDPPAPPQGPPPPTGGLDALFQLIAAINQILAFFGPPASGS